MKKTGLFLLVMLSVQSFATVAGQFYVSARNPFGESFTNYYAGPIKVAFLGLGHWSFAPGMVVDSEGNANDVCSNYGKCTLDYGFVGSLIAKQNTDYHHVGYYTEFDIESNETVYFLMNDAGTAFGDNSGSMKVQWICLEGCEE